MFTPEVGGPSPYTYSVGQNEDFQFDYDAFSASQKAAPRNASSFSSSNLLKPGERFNAKVPPSFNGGSWFQYEEDVRDWLTMTDLSEERQGPALKNAIQGHMVWLQKKTLLRTELIKKDGVEYLLNKLRPHYLKGATHIFLFRMKIFLMQRRGRMDFSDWIVKWDLAKEKMMGAWMDLAKEVTSVEDTRYAGLLQLVKAGMSADEFNNVSGANRILAVNAKIKEQHAEKFPFGAMLSTIMFC